MDKQKKEKEPVQEVFTGYQDEYAGQGGSYLYDPETKQRTPITEEGNLKNG